MFLTKVVEKIKTYFMLNIVFSPENRVVFEMTWKKYGKAGQATDDNVIGRMRCEWRITEGYSGNSGYANAPQCYVTRTLPVSFYFRHLCSCDS